MWQGSNSEDLPGGGEHTGNDAAVQVMRRADSAWDQFSLTADEFYEDDDTIVVLGHTDVSKVESRRSSPSFMFGASRTDRQRGYRYLPTPCRALGLSLIHI